MKPEADAVDLPARAKQATEPTLAEVRWESLIEIRDEGPLVDSKLGRTATESDPALRSQRPPDVVSCKGEPGAARSPSAVGRCRLGAPRVGRRCRGGRSERSRPATE